MRWLRARNGILSLAGMMSLLASGPAAAQSFVGLGIPPGENFNHATGLSGDGSTAVGFSGLGDEAFRWTASEGLVDLGDFPGLAHDVAAGVSYDGATIVGHAKQPSGSSLTAIYWSAGAIVSIGDLPGGAVSSIALATSADGSVIVGFGSDATGSKAFRWTELGGMVSLGELPGGGTDSLASSVSADGNIVVGDSSSSASTIDGLEAFRWTESEGMVGLGWFAGEPAPVDGFLASATGVSGDGSTIVGIAGGLGEEDVNEAFRWTAATGMVRLDEGPSSTPSIATAASYDGSIIVGQWGSNAFVWDATHGVRLVADVLTGAGIDMTGWVLERARAISWDGRTIAGTGRRNGVREAWVASLAPPPPACDDQADNDGDGLTDYPEDPGCKNASAPKENPRCDDELDNDGDGGTDWDGGALGLTPDAECIGKPARDRETPSTGGCGVGAELVPLLGLLGWRVRRRDRPSAFPRRSESRSRTDSRTP